MPIYKENSSVPAQLREWGAIATLNMLRETRLHGGTTLDLSTGRVPAHTFGYMVGGAIGYRGDKIEAVVIPEGEFSIKTLRQAVGFLYAEHLTAEELEGSAPIVNGYVGTWVSDGLVYVDASNWTADYSEAVRWAQERGEQAIYDIESNACIDVSAPLAIAV